MDDIFCWCREGRLLQVRLWLDEPLNDVNQGDDHGFGPLHWACLAGHAQLAEMLIGRGARLNAVNMGDDTALHLASSHGHPDCAALLLRNKADVNLVNEHGNSPLHYACFWGHLEVAEMLMSHGAQANAANLHGNTPVDVCHRRLAERLIELASLSGQDLSRKASNKDSLNNNITENTGSVKTTDAKLSRHPDLKLAELQLNTRVSTSPSGETWRGTWGQPGVEINAKFIAYNQHSMDSARVSRIFGEEFPKLRIFSHPNLLPVLGACNEPPALVVVNQHLPLGALFGLLHERKQFVVDGLQAARFALDIARGMAFLHALEPLVSRFYLNSYHVLIDDNLNAKLNLADAKFSFQERHKVYQPAWFAPEALQRPAKDINQRSADMWSFSVLLWEILARQVPFGGLSPLECGMKIALEDLRLTAMAAQVAPNQHLAKLMRICMNDEPSKRPSFDQLVPILTKIAHAN